MGLFIRVMPDAMFLQVFITYMAFLTRLFDKIFSRIKRKIKTQPFGQVNSNILELPGFAERLYYRLTKVILGNHIVADHIVPGPSFEVCHVGKYQVCQRLCFTIKRRYGNKERNHCLILQYLDILFTLSIYVNRLIAINHINIRSSKTAVFDHFQNLMTYVVVGEGGITGKAVYYV